MIFKVSSNPYHSEILWLESSLCILILAYLLTQHLIWNVENCGLSDFNWRIKLVKFPEDLMCANINILIILWFFQHIHMLLSKCTYTPVVVECYVTLVGINAAKSNICSRRVNHIISERSRDCSHLHFIGLSWMHMQFLCTPLYSTWSQALVWRRWLMTVIIFCSFFCTSAWQHNSLAWVKTVLKLF